MLDEKDKIIFENLLHNCRTSIKHLSKLVNLSEPTIIHRINKLEKKEYISKYDAILNYNKISQKLQFILLKIPKKKEKEFDQILLKNKNIISIYHIINKYNYLIVINTENINKFQTKYSEYIIQLKNYQFNKIDFFPFSIFDIPIKYKPKLAKKQPQTTKPIKFDKIDIKLIKHLTNGGGKDSILEISKKLKINYDIILYRFKKLKKENLFPLFITQPNIKHFPLQIDFLILNTKNITHNEVLEKIKILKKFIYLIKINENKYLTQIYSLSYKEYKITLEKIWQNFSEKLIDIEIYTTKEWILLNRFNFKTLKNQTSIKDKN